MERKSFLGLVIGAIIGLILLFLVYMFFFKNNEDGRSMGDAIRDFFPIGGDIDNNNNGGEPGDDIFNSEDNTVFIPKLRRLSLAPAAGYIAYDRATTTRTIVGTSTVQIATTTEMAARYIDKSTGHIYETNENTLAVTRISNTTLGIFDEATFSNPSSFVARRFNENTAQIDAYIGSLVRISTTSDELRTTGTTFPRHPESMAVRGTSIFSLYEYPLNSEGYITQTTPIRETKIFSSVLSGWNAEWINKDLLLLTTKANAGYDGYVYSLNVINGRMTELLGPKSGLIAKVNNNLTAAVYSESYSGKLLFFMHNFTKDTFVQLSSQTLPEKCVFSAKAPMIAYCAVPRPLPAGSYPEDWYKGKVQFDDAIIKIDIERNEETLVVNLAQEGGVAIDAVNLSLNEKENFLVFQNKRDGNVWSFDLR